MVETEIEIDLENRLMSGLTPIILNSQFPFELEYETR